MRGPSFNQPTTAHVARPGLYVVSPADPWIERMEDDNSLEDQLILAACCLRHDPGCIEARTLLAKHAETHEIRIEHLRKAVHTGEELWTPIAEELGFNMRWWGLSGTRGYMRAIHALGNALLETGAETEARACFERLMAMNPNDNQGIRYVVEELDTEADVFGR